MKSSQKKGKGTEELHQLFKKLEQEWKAYKESKPTTSRRHSLPPSNETIHKLHQYSPRELMFNLQQESPSTPEAWKNVEEVREILQERKEAIERGKLKGRRLFQSTTSEGESSDCEVRSMSFCNLEDESNGSEGMHGYCTRSKLSSLSSSSSSCSGDDNHLEDMEKITHLMATIDTRVASFSGMHGNGRVRYAVFLCGVILLVIAMCIRLAKSFGGDDCDMILVPT